MKRLRLCRCERGLESLQCTILVAAMIGIVLGLQWSFEHHLRPALTRATDQQFGPIDVGPNTRNVP